MSRCIPSVIHLCSATKTPPEKYAAYYATMRALHPDWDIRIWDDDDALQIVDTHFVEWKEKYRAYPVPVQRVDIFRVMLMYLYGGFYLDMDMHCFKSLDDLSMHPLVLGIEKTLVPGLITQEQYPHAIRIANYMFGSQPGHPFWQAFLEQARELPDHPVRKENDVLDTTGPGLLTHVYHTAKTRYNDITLLDNPDKACWKHCGEASCHFGDYAVHLHLGSWRWESGN